MQFTVNTITYDFVTAPKFVRKEVALLTERYGTDLDTAPEFVRHKARLLAERYGVPGTP